jgi:hypothetical protein
MDSTTLFKKYIASIETIEAIYFLNKVVESINYTNTNFSNLPKSNKSDSFHLNSILTILPESIGSNNYTSQHWKPLSLCQTELLYVLKPNPYNNWSSNDPHFNLNSLQLNSLKSLTFDLNTIHNLNTHKNFPVLLNFNLYSNLSNAKQDRWLLRNSLLSNSGIIDSNSYTQAKKLIGYSSLDSISNSSNIWNSSKISSLSKYNELDYLGYMRNLTSNTDRLFSSDDLKILKFLILFS